MAEKTKRKMRGEKKKKVKDKKNKKKNKKNRRWLRINRKTHLKMLTVFSGIILILAFLTWRLMYIEHTDGARYQKIVLAQQAYDSAVIPYRRGDITDCRGVVLATSRDVYNVILDCDVLTSKEEYLEPTIHALMTSFPEDIDETELRSYIKEHPDSKYRVLATQLSYEKVEAFLAMQSDKDAEDAGSIAGIWFEKEYIRDYPCKSLASSVVGFTTSGNVGMTGLENYYNDTLNGSNGRQYGYLNSDNSVEKTIKDAVDGNNIVTTIDTNIQAIVEKKIAEFDKAYRNQARTGPGAEHMGVIIEDPNTGGILAMADFPSYDLTKPRSLKAHYTEEEIAAMSEKEELDALNQLWRNFCISDTFEPGSVQKPLTVACGLDSGRLTGSEWFECDGVEKIADREITCVAKSGHGPESVEGALMDSCNDALMQMARIIGKENFCSYQRNFGMGLMTNIDLPGEERTDALVRTVEETSAVDLATESFGQGYNCTMIQMISAFCSIINGGNYYKPRIVSKITDENGSTVKEIKPELLKQTVSREVSEQIKEYLYATVSKGSAKTAKVPGYSMGGKTGTAEKVPRKNGNYLVSYIGYLPQEDPQLVIYAVIDVPNQSTSGEAQAHSTFAQNLAREILEEILPYMNIYKDEEVDKKALKKKDTNMYTEIKGYEHKAALGEAVAYD